MADTPRAPVPHVAGIYRLLTRPRRRHWWARLLTPAGRWTPQP